jgi:hypothetical protein
MILASSLLFNCWEFSIRHPGIVLVLFGVAGEVIFDWKEMKGRLAWAKRISALVLIAGLILEFSEAAKSDKGVSAAIERAGIAEKEAGQANERAATNELAVATLTSSNLVLSIELEKLKQDRTITDEDKKKFIKLLASAPRGSFSICFEPNSGADVQNYANEIWGMFLDAGFNVSLVYGMGTGLGKIPKGVFIVVNSTNQAPYAGIIQQAFKAIGVDAEGYVDDSLKTNDMRIVVGRKP